MIANTTVSGFVYKQFYEVRKILRIRTPIRNWRPPDLSRGSIFVQLWFGLVYLYLMENFDTRTIVGFRYLAHAWLTAYRVG